MRTLRNIFFLIPSAYLIYCALEMVPVIPEALNDKRFDSILVPCILFLGGIGFLSLAEFVKCLLFPKQKPLSTVWLHTSILSGIATGFISIWIFYFTHWYVWIVSAFMGFLTCSAYNLFRTHRFRAMRAYGWTASIIAGMLLSFTLYEVRLSQQTFSWPNIEGRITDSGSSRWSNCDIWSERCCYEYSVNGKHYTGSNFNIGSSRLLHGERACLDEFCVPYAWHEPCKVFYHPRKPSVAVLSRGLSFATMLSLKISIFSLIAGTILISIAGYSRRQTRSSLLNASSRCRCSYIFSKGTRFLIPFAVLCVTAVWITVTMEPATERPMNDTRKWTIPNSAEGYSKRADGLFSKGLYKSATTNLTHAISLDPNQAIFYFNRAILYDRQNQKVNAIKDLKHAIHVDWKMAYPCYYKQKYEIKNQDLEQLVLETILSHLDEIEDVEGYAVGFGAEPGHFYTASLVVSEHFKEDQLYRNGMILPASQVKIYYPPEISHEDKGANSFVMGIIGLLENENPVIRAMGLICLARKDYISYKPVIESLFNDAATFIYRPVGCGGWDISLGKFTQSIIEDPNTLDYWSPEHWNWLGKDNHNNGIQPNPRTSVR